MNTNNPDACCLGLIWVDCPHCGKVVCPDHRERHTCTPHRWHYTYYEEFGHYAVQDIHNDDICILADTEDFAEENAMLIARAPKMLAFIKEIAEFYEGTDSSFGTDASTLVAQATGQGTPS